MGLPVRDDLGRSADHAKRDPGPIEKNPPIGQHLLCEYSIQDLRQRNGMGPPGCDVSKARIGNQRRHLDCFCQGLAIAVR